jgi:hypothetical protein
LWVAQINLHFVLRCSELLKLLLNVVLLQKQLVLLHRVFGIYLLYLNPVLLLLLLVRLSLQHLTRQYRLVPFLKLKKFIFSELF